MIKKYNFTVKRGDSFRQKINVFRDGVPADITGWKIYFTLKKKKSDPDSQAIIKRDITDHTNPTLGESMLLCLPSETKELKGTYYFDLQIKRSVTLPIPYDDIQTPLEGSITFTEDVTLRDNGET